MKENMELDRNSSFFMHIREFRNEDNVYETAGATSGAVEHGDYGEAYMLFTRMYEAGWRMSEEEFEQRKKQFWEILEEHCPKGKHYLAVEYECSEDISLNFYEKEYLDTIPKPREGSASSIFMCIKPEKEEGIHGYKLRGCVIQKPLDGDVHSLEAELFSYSELVQKRVEEL